jgi:flagellar hook-length control protein FliK
MVPVPLHPVEADMPTVEWAQTSAVSRSAPSLRDQPEQSGDVFAAVFDSARRSAGSRVDQTVREQQRAERNESARPVMPERSPAGEQTRKKRSHKPENREEGKHAATPPASTEQAGSAEADRPSKPESDTEPYPRAESEDAEKPKPSEDRDQSADTEGLPQTERTQDPPLPVESIGDSEHPSQTVSANDAARVVELTNELRAPLQGQWPFLPEIVAGQSVPAPNAAAPASAEVMMKRLSSSGEGATADAAAAAVPVTTAPAESGLAENAAQPQPSETDRSLPDMPPLRVWSALRELILNSDRGLGVRLAEVVASVVGKPAAPESPSAKATNEKASADVVAGRPAVSQAAVVVLSAALDNQGVSWDQKGKKSAQDRSAGGDGTRGSALETARAADTGTPQNGVTGELRGLLEAAGRVRERIASPGPQPETAFIGRNLDGKGVNLSGARAINELADVVRANTLGRNSSILLRLDPPELGQLRIDVRMQGQELILRLQADTLAGHDALRSRLQELRSSLEQHGFKVNQLDVELRVPQAPAAEPHQDRASQQQSHWDGQAWREPGWQGQAHGGGDTSAESEFSQDNSAFSGENASIGEEHDGAGRPAETGVDLVV